MSGVPYHAWTHRPKAQGGTDPIPSSAIEVWRFRSTTATVNTGLTTLAWFEDDSAGSSDTVGTHTVSSIARIQIRRPGVYAFDIYSRGWGTEGLASSVTEIKITVSDGPEGKWISQGLGAFSSSVKAYALNPERISSTTGDPDVPTAPDDIAFVLAPDLHTVAWFPLGGGGGFDPDTMDPGLLNIQGATLDDSAGGPGTWAYRADAPEWLLGVTRLGDVYG